MVKSIIVGKEKELYNCTKRVKDDPQSIIAKEHFSSENKCYDFNNNNNNKCRDVTSKTSAEISANLPYFYRPKIHVKIKYK